MTNVDGPVSCMLARGGESRQNFIGPGQIVKNGFRANLLAIPLSGPRSNGEVTLLVGVIERSLATKCMWFMGDDSLTLSCVIRLDLTII